MKRILDGTRRLPVGSDYYTMAKENVKERWVEQGIWNNKWNEMASGRWKHEEPLEPESESETDSEAPTPLFSFQRPKRRRPKSDEEKRRTAERRAVRERERKASRPYHQFVYQISKERERMQDESTSGEGTGVGIPNINTTAYENIKNTWTKRGIWNKRWGILPGMSWKHEEPLDEETADGPVAVLANPVGNGSHEVGEAPLRNIFGRPVTNLSESGIFIRNPPPVESNHQASGTMNTSQQGPSADIDLAGLENGDVDRSPAPNLPHPRRGKRVLHPTTGQALRPSKPTRKDEQPQPVASASLGPFHSSKISKAARKRSPGPRRRSNVPRKVSSGDPPLSSGPDIAEPPPQAVSMPPRRSKRIQPPEPSTPKDPTSTDPLKGIARSRPRRNVSGNPISMGSAKPQGISKRQPVKTTQRKARK
jgi:hypothetical protein